MTTSGMARVLAKAEYFNPGGSIKDRICLAMIEDGEKESLMPDFFPTMRTTSAAWPVASATKRAAVWASIAIAKKMGGGKTVVTILSGTGERYLSMLK